MNTEQIMQGNRLIAEFIGWEFKIEEEVVFGFVKGEIKGVEIEGNFDEIFLNGSEYLSFNFHNSWAMIMPIAEKVLLTKWLEPGTNEDHGFYHFVTFGMRNQTTGKIMVRISGFGLHEANTLIEALWLALVEFTEYYSTLAAQKKCVVMPCDTCKHSCHVHFCEKNHWATEPDKTVINCPDYESNGSLLD